MPLWSICAPNLKFLAPTIPAIWKGSQNSKSRSGDPNECLTTLPLTVFTQRNFVADFLQAKWDFTRKSAVLRPPLGDLGTAYDDHLRLIRKRVVDFLLVLVELFSLGVTAEALRAIIGSKSAILLQRGPVDPKFQVQGVAPHQPFYFSENYTKCSFVWYKILDRSFHRFVAMHACVRQTDRQNSHDRVCISCSAVKMILLV